MKGLRQLQTFELTDTTTSTTGVSTNQVKIWLKKLLDAAKTMKFFEAAVSKYTLAQGTKDLVVPYRTGYLASMDDDTTEGGAMTFTALDNLSGVTFTPTIHAHGVAISNHTIRTNALNYVEAAREELTEYFANTTDKAVRTILENNAGYTSNTSMAQTAAKGIQVLYGGDATEVGELSAGDVITTDLVAEARRRLMSTTCMYWDDYDASATEGTSSAAKNPWTSTPGEPFMLFIAPEQDEAFLKDSQFVNAAEYGTGEIVVNGEIGKYIGIKIVVTPNLTLYGTGSTPDWGVNGHRCMLVKTRVCAGMATHGPPKLHVFPFPSELETRLILEATWKAELIHTDAIVHINVTDA